MKFGAICCIYNDIEYLDAVLIPNSNHLDEVLFLVNDCAWNGEKYDNSETLAKLKEYCDQSDKFKIIQSHWDIEADQRNEGLLYFYKNNFDWCFIIDNDEVYFEQQFINIKEFVKAKSQFDAFHVECNTYWKRYYRIVPREDAKPAVIVRPSKFHFVNIRTGITSIIRNGNIVIRTNEKIYNGTVIPPRIAVCHHFSYARSDEFVKRKMLSSSHATANEIVKNWYEKVWLKWNVGMRNLHPVTPNQYQQAIEEDFVNFPPQMQKFIKKERLSDRLCSIIILNWNSYDLLKRCLELVSYYTTRKYEIIIVDNGSKDESVKYIKSLNYRSILHPENLGFAKGVNSAIRSTQGSDICLLNVDAEPTQGWLEALYNTLLTQPNAGLVGPVGNEVEPWKSVAKQFDKAFPVITLSAYCLLIMREVIDKIGIFDERFEIGSYEDNDYCMRAQLAGYSVFMNPESNVVHKPHQVFEANKLDWMPIQAQNEKIFWAKVSDIIMKYGEFYNFYRNPNLAEQTGLIVL